ncbi:Alpha/Beta hydrolase protein [Roridomyces roridus]|uniref:Alpha/Beta hydrolase protein n=1 Tax=Roridomyces roridus TaxID=1738132 RepID=A0AAD7FP78_9AGAR|nr:Alpha/Beta hydrolase protein [Roridomyces roridus]
MVPRFLWPFYSSPEPCQPPEPTPKPGLHHYANPGVAPPTARVEPTLRVPAHRAPIPIWHLWKYGIVLVSKATEMTGAVIAHNLWGPRRRSWTIEMTIITSFMRGAGAHSSLVDIATIRMLMGLGGLMPLPSDALVTPLTWRVKRRKLRGILADLDAAETGYRELSGEWVVGRRTWQRLQAEWKLAQQGCPTPGPQRKKERVVLYIHGGAYYLSSAAGQRLISIPLSKYTDARVFALDYRLAPETRFPGPLHDAVTAYLRLVEDLQIPAENIVICGDSAGGGLSLALLMYLRDNAYPLPSSAILMSPWVDLTMSCDSWESNAPFDVVPMPSATSHMNPIALYLGDQVEQYLTHPYASPLFGDFNGLPPLLIQAGDAEVLRDEIALLAHKATCAGVAVRHELYEDAVHIFQTYPFLDASRRAFISMGDFVRSLPVQAQSTLGEAVEEGLEHEIGSSAATVVRGDGVASQAGKEELEEEERTESEPEEDTQKVWYPSWGPSRRTSFFSPPTSDDDSEDEDYSELAKSVPPPMPESTSTLRRIQSAVSVIIPKPETRPPLKRHRSQHFHHRRTSSREQIPTLKSFTMMDAPPSPLIRRNSNASHPDITRLVENWTQTGPANETLIYKPYSKPP